MSNRVSRAFVIAVLFVAAIAFVYGVAVELNRETAPERCVRLAESGVTGAPARAECDAAFR